MTDEQLRDVEMWTLEDIEAHTARTRKDLAALKRAKVALDDPNDLAWEEIVDGVLADLEGGG